MKKCLLFFLPLLCCFYSHAQVTLSESFDGATFLPDGGWANLFVSAQSNSTPIAWSRVTGGSYPSQSPHSGAGELRLNSYDANGGSRALVTPAFDLSARGTTGTPTVSFWMYRDGGYSTTGDVVDVYVNTTSSLSGATLLGSVNRSTGLTPTVAASGWYQYTYNIPTTFNGATNYLFFQGTSAYGNDVYVDDIQWISYPTACTGTPSPGNTVSSSPISCGSRGFTLSNQNIFTASGISYQWQSSSNGTSFSNISSATLATLTTTQSATTYYRCQVTCSGNTGTSTPVVIPYFSSCHCVPSSTNCTFDDRIDSVKIATLSNGSGCTSGGYTDYSASIAAPELNIGSTNNMRVRVGPGGTEYVGVWIDYNHDGSYGSGEFTALGSGNGSTVVSSISIPSTATLGYTLMRVRVRYNTALTDADACASYTYGETEDYLVNIVCKVSVASNPSNATTCAGSNASFSADGKGYSPTYQWEVNSGSGFSTITNGGVYSNATTAVLNITGVTAGMAGYQYRCVIGTACGTATATTSAATLNLAPAPAIATQPVDRIICDGANTTFTATATGPVGLTYQWQVNTGSGFTNISNSGKYSGATTNTLSITGATASMNTYQYRFVASACNQPTNSNAATLTVNTLPAITAHPSPTTVCPGGVATFTGAGTGTGVTYQWRVYINNGAGYSNLTNGGIYSGVNTPTLTINGVSSAINNYSYQLAISGTCAPIVYTNGGRLTVSSSVSIPVQPDSTPVTCEGANKDLTVYSPNAGVTYQWQVNNGSGFANISNGAAYSGATTGTLTIIAPTLSMDRYRYRCVLNTSCTAAGVNSNTSILTVNAKPVLTSQPAAVTQCEGLNTSFGVTATGYNLSYRWQQNSGSGWINVPNGAPYSGQNSNTLSLLAPNVALNGYQYRCVVTGTCAVVTSNAVTLTLYGKPRITTDPVNRIICNGSSTTFGVVATGTSLTYQWQVDNAGIWANLANAGTYTGVTTATLSLAAPQVSLNGSHYRCVITGTCSPSIATDPVVLYINTPPVVTSQPVNEVVCAGSIAGFSIASYASPNTPTTFQWQVNDGSGFINLSNNSTYSGTRARNLKINNTPLSYNNYIYRCVVTTTCSPSAISDEVSLTVNSLPAITKQPVNATVCPGSVATFSVAGTGTGIYYEWQVDTGTGFMPVPSVGNYAGSNSDMLAVTATANMNNYVFRCKVAGTCTPALTSGGGKLTVLRPINILSQTTVDSVCEGGHSQLGVKVSGTALRYQWQVRNASGAFVNLNNIPPYSGTNTDSLRLTEVPDSLDGKVYRCAVSENVICNQTFFTDDMTVVVNLAPPVTPASLTLGFFSSATFNVTPDGQNYQWQENRNDGGGYRSLVENAMYSGVKTNTLTVKPVNYEMSGFMYRCIIDGICEQPAISKPGKLIVDAALGMTNVSKNEVLNMSVFPNPLSGSQLNVRFDRALKGKTEVRVMDKLGKLVFNGTLEMNTLHTAGIELQQLAAGVYMLQVVNEAEKINQSVRFTKQ